MSIKLSINVSTANAVEDTNKIANQLKDLNLRGVKVKQVLAQPKEGSLGIEEYMPLLELVIQTGLATAAVTQVFSLLKDGFFSKTKEIAANRELKLAELDTQIQLKTLDNQAKEFEIRSQEILGFAKITSDNEIETKKIEEQDAKRISDEIQKFNEIYLLNELEQKKIEKDKEFIELLIEHGEDKYNFKFSKDNSIETEKILNLIVGFQNKTIE